MVCLPVPQALPTTEGPAALENTQRGHREHHGGVGSPLAC